MEFSSWLTDVICCILERVVVFCGFWVLAEAVSSVHCGPFRRVNSKDIAGAVSRVGS